MRRASISTLRGADPALSAEIALQIRVASFGTPRVASSRSSLLARFFRLVAELHDVALREEDALQHLAPLRLLAEEELEIHPEVFHLLVLGVLHDRLRLAILLEREALLVPPDRFGLLDQ